MPNSHPGQIVADIALRGPPRPATDGSTTLHDRGADRSRTDLAKRAAQLGQRVVQRLRRIGSAAECGPPSRWRSIRACSSPGVGIAARIEQAHHARIRAELGQDVVEDSELVGSGCCASRLGRRRSGRARRASALGDVRRLGKVDCDVEGGTHDRANRSQASDEAANKRPGRRQPPQHAAPRLQRGQRDRAAKRIAAAAEQRRAPASTARFDSLDRPASWPQLIARQSLPVG